jgi:hypothetical protein
MPLSRRLVLGGVGALALPRPVFGQTAGRQVALAIGVNRYEYVEKLTRPIADAEAIALKLKSIGYEAQAVPDPDRSTFNRSVDAFIESIGPGTSAIFFFAGHGFQSGGANYLTTRETKASKDQIYETSIALKDVLARMAARRPRQGIVILDACREASWVPGTIAQRQGFSGIEAPSGFYVVYSAGSGELALDDLGEGDKNPNSVFTRAFLKKLDAHVSIDEAVKAARPEVTCLAGTVNHPQHPATYDQTSAELTLAGEPVSGRRSVLKAAGVLPKTRALLVAVEGEDAMRLIAPRADVRFLADRLRAFDVEPTVLINPTLSQVEKALADLAGVDAENVLVYWSGHGGYVDYGAGQRDAAFVLHVDPNSSKATEVVTLGGMARKLRAPGRRTLVLADTCLVEVILAAADDPQLVRAGFALSGVESAKDAPALSVMMGSLIGDDEKQAKVGNTAVLFAGGFGTPALDIAPGMSRGPFSTAIANALTRPGLSVRDFASVVRDDVEDITGGMQSPLLLGVRTATLAPLVVQRSGCQAA